MTESRITPGQDECAYSSCYCLWHAYRRSEENVWKLCESVRTEGSAPLQELFVVFISNDNRTVPLWKQKSASGEQPVIWVGRCQDYHVVLLHVPAGSEAAVYDLDSVLPFPCALKLYATRALRSDRGIQPAYHRKLRVVPADCFLSNFASDRSHMKNADGTWKMPPPPLPPISTADSHMNLDDFICMEPSRGWGRIFTLDHFLRSYAKDAASPPFS